MVNLFCYYCHGGERNLQPHHRKSPVSLLHPTILAAGSHRKVSFDMAANPTATPFTHDAQLLGTTTRHQRSCGTTSSTSKATTPIMGVLAMTKCS
ncbi:unnamed protein product [Urochloa humidicola]